MKLTFECKLTMFDYIPDGAVASTKEEIARDLAECIKDELSDSGGVSITDVTLTGWIPGTKPQKGEQSE